MWPCPIEIRNIGMQNTMQQLFMEDQHVVKALSPHTPQETFTDGIGLWGVIGRFKHLDTARSCNSSETGTKLTIIITDEIFRRVSIGSRLSQRYVRSKCRWEIASPQRGSLSVIAVR